MSELVTAIPTPKEDDPEFQHYQRRWELWRDCLLASLTGGSGPMKAIEAADKIAETYRLRCEKELKISLYKGDTTRA